MDVLERNAILQEIRRKDFAEIFQAMLDAERVEHDPMKRGALATTLGFAMAERTPNPEFLKLVWEFLNSRSNIKSEKDHLLGALGLAASKETVDLLIRVATTSADADNRQGAIALLAAVGGQSRVGVELSSALEQLWRESDDENLLRAAARSIAIIGSDRGIELLLSAALTEAKRDKPRKLIAQNALVEVYKSSAVPSLSARLTNQMPGSEAGKLIAPILVRIGDATAGKAIVTWIQWIPEDAGPFVRHLVVQETRNSAMLAAWKAALDPDVSFGNEKNREAIRVGYDIRKR